MIDFIICDDDSIVVEKVVKVVSNIMMKNRLEYNIHTFNDYDDEFIKFISRNNHNCVYILDIETPSRSGIDVARIIRKNDIESVIIFLTGHEELGQIVLKKELLFLAFINKFEDSFERLNSSILEALRMLSIKKILRFEERGTIYTISVNDILYITRDSIDRKSVIKTNNNEFRTYKSLVEIKSMLDDRFCKTHRACIINKDRVCKINKQKKIIVFDNGLSIDLISDKYKKELVNN